ncbi:hypothetical protein D5086_017242 [Populus alba]|uniref:Uncharacterized protein n=1 Tax=Populus alba TaxID=43335 RepID=A0ACC4BWT5_POPAL
MLLAHANYNMYLVVTESLHPNTSSPLWSGLEGENLDYWKVVLILKEILVFMTDQFIVEPYFPDLFARQFGLCEDIPIPLLAKIVNVESLQMSSTYLELSPSCRVTSFELKDVHPLTIVPFVGFDFTPSAEDFTKHDKQERVMGRVTVSYFEDLI